MNKTGTITQIVDDGGYSGQNGYVHTFQMTIDCPDGQFTGQIGAKSKPYPLLVGAPISVEITNTEHGTRFKKFNPQYSGQGSPKTPQNAPQSTSRDYDKENRGKCRFGLYQALVQSGLKPLLIVNDAPLLAAVETLVRFSMEGIGGTKNPDYVGEQEGTQMSHQPILDDDIPF